MPEVPAYEGDLSEAARLIYGEAVPQHARYAAMKPTTLSLSLGKGGGGIALIIAIVGFWVVSGICSILIIMGAFIASGGADIGAVLGIVTCAFVPFVIVGTVLVVLFGRRFATRLTRKRTGDEICRISNTQPRPGESIDVSYDLGFEGEMQVEGTTIQLIRRETAIYTSGTDRHTVHHETLIEGEQFMGRSVRPGDFLSESASFTLPADAMHTFIANRNRVLWMVKVKVAIKGRPDITSLYHLVVLP